MRWRRLIKTPALFSFLLSSALFGQAPQSPVNSKAVDAIFSSYTKPGSPGCSLGVMENGKMIYAKGYGLADLEWNIPNSPSTVFDIGSTSKQFTAASIVLLEEQGKLSLDDNIAKYLPEMPAYAQDISIRELLYHTSGIRDYLTLMQLAGVNFDGVTTDDDALSLIARQKALNFTPGSEFLYSNSGFFLLSIIVKHVTGKNLAEFEQKNIFDPLDMKHTLVLDNHTRIIPRRATGYAPKKEGGFQRDMSGFEQTGDGAVQTTVEDLLRWDDNFCHPTIGGERMIHELLTPGVLNSGKKIDYALGLMVGKYRGLPTVSHGGAWAGYRAEMLRFPAQHFSVACLCNVANANPSALARKVADVYWGKVMGPEEKSAAAESKSPVKLSEEEQSRFEGVYRSKATGTFRRVTLHDHKLWIGPFGSRDLELQPVSPTEFHVVGVPGAVTVRFEPVKNVPAPDFAPYNLVISSETSSPETLESVAPFYPTPLELLPFTGDFYSSEIDTTYTFWIKDNKLGYQIKNLPFQTLEPTYRDAFVDHDGIQFDFIRDLQGNVSGFVIQAGRTRSLLFLKKNP